MMNPLLTDLGLSRSLCFLRDYNFGLPQFPYISGREFSGDVVLPSGGEGGDWASSKDGSKNRVN